MTGHGRARLETQSERLSSFISIVTGHETNIVAYGTLDRVSQHVQCCCERLAQKAVAQLPATTMSSMWTYASRWRMSARVYGAELELSSSSVVPVQRMSMEWAVAGTAMAALDFERRRLGFIASKVRFCHELHCKVKKTHPHVDRIDGTVSGRVGTDRDGTGRLGTGGCPANNVRGASPRTRPRAGASLSVDVVEVPVL